MTDTNMNENATPRKARRRLPFLRRAQWTKLLIAGAFASAERRASKAPQGHYHDHLRKLLEELGIDALFTVLRLVEGTTRGWRSGRARVIDRLVRRRRFAELLAAGLSDHGAA